MVEACFQAICSANKTIYRALKKRKKHDGANDNQKRHGITTFERNSCPKYDWMGGKRERDRMSWKWFWLPRYLRE